MAIGPERLQGVTTDGDDLLKLKRGGRERGIRPFVNVSHDIGLSMATGAGAAPPQRFQRNEGFLIVFPLDGEFFANGLDVLRSHPFIVTRSWPVIKQEKT